jgi:pyruvate/2-oxoglutarate dehydrogenase complex dihydrolipoamide acyltransferase (E2) component
MPMINPSLLGGTVSKWHKAEGDHVGFGEDICTVALDEFAVLRRTARATLLSGSKQKRLKSGLEKRQGKVWVEVVLTASDQSVLEKIIKDEGESIAIGDTLAVVSTSPFYGELTHERWDDAPAMRVVANMNQELEHN